MLKGWRERVTGTDIVMWLIGAAILGVVIVGSTATLASGRYSGRHWFDFMVFGLAQGSIYALIAMGYTMVYGVLRMINFAHSEVFMSGPYTPYYVAAAFHRSGLLDSHPFLSMVVVFLVSMATSTLIAFLLERIAYRPLRGAPRLIPLITAIGASFFLQYMFRGLYGPGFQAYPVVKALEGQFVFLGLRILKFQALVIVAAAILMFALYSFLQRTRVGKAYIGFIAGIKAFTAAVLGGIGNIPGAMLGGIFLGLIESVGPSLFLDGLGIVAPYQLKDAIAFTMLVLVLIFRPTGIMGERLAVKKA